MRHAAKRDINEKPIVDCLRKCGVHVTYLDQPVDLLCIHEGNIELLEVKGPKGHLTEGQMTFIFDAGNHGKEIHVVTTIQEALQAIFGDNAERMLEPDKLREKGL